MANDRRHEFAALLACCQAAQDARVPWWQVARAVERAGAVEPLIAGPWEPGDRWEYEVAAALALHLRRDSLARWETKVVEWEAADDRLRYVTILDSEYPPSLRLIFNPPPFLVLRGSLLERDARGVAVVGTRHPTDEGVRRARRLAAELAQAGITVYSGLAAGIDTAAHLGALEGGGRTVGVVGHGLLRPIYPKENGELADRIAESAALVSQFRPDTPPSRYTFPMRNAVTSGLSQGTVVVEASHTSGARMQARLAAEHGKRVWLLESLVRQFPWAEKFRETYAPSTRVVADVSDVLEELQSEDEITALAQGDLPPVPEAEKARRPEPEPLQLFAVDS
jgi:DNA processing protein